VVGFDEERGERRTFKVERIRSVTLTAEQFAEPPAAVVAEMRNAWDVIGDQAPVDIVIRFSPDVAQRVDETRWHPSQQTAREADGSLTWRGRVAGVLEIRAWILGWGAAAEVLEPPELREWAAHQHAAAAQRYR
jgi:predicted DNA-binding transcriptional regulator YafY